MIGAISSPGDGRHRIKNLLTLYAPFLCQHLANIQTGIQLPTRAHSTLMLTQGRKGQGHMVSDAHAVFKHVKSFSGAVRPTPVMGQHDVIQTRLRIVRPLPSDDRLTTLIKRGRQHCLL